MAKAIITIGTEEDKNKKDVIVKELTLGQVFSIVQISEEEKGKSVLDIMKDKLSMVTDLKWEEAQNYTPSELKIVWEKVKEINKDFFDISAFLKLDKTVNLLLESITRTFQQSFTNTFTSSSKADTGIEKS